MEISDINRLLLVIEEERNIQEKQSKKAKQKSKSKGSK